jgi:DNA-binding transcriptional LysR family regulator
MAAILPTTLERLRVFHTVASAGTLAGAARSLGYTPSAVSQHLTALEREAGVALVERSNRGVVLTAAGRRLAERASDVLDLVRVTFDDLATANVSRETVLTVAAFPTAISSMLLPLHDRLTPTIRLIIVDAEPAAALRALRSREVDCAITDGYSHELATPDDDLHRIALRAEPIRLIARADRPMRRSLAAYADAPWVLGGPRSRLGFAALEACRAAGFVPRVIAETDDHHIAFDVIRAADAVALLPELALTNLPAEIAVVRRVDVRLERLIEFVTRRSLRSSAAISALAVLLTAIG